MENAPSLEQDLYSLVFLPGRDTRIPEDRKKQWAALYVRLIRHILLLGRTGSGKTTVMLRMLRAALKADMGFIFLSFHHPPCRDAAALCATHGLKPEKDVIIMYPKLTEEVGACVKVNPLDLPDTMATTFVDMVKQISKAWGDRMDPIFIQCVRSVMNLNTQYRNMSGLYNWAANPVSRYDMIPKMTNEELKDYWQVVFPEKYGKNPEEALSPIISRLLRIMANFHARSAFDVRLGDKKLDFVDIIRNRKKVIIDLSGLDASTAEFMSAIIMLLVYAARDKLKEREESEKNTAVMPFLLMVDEVQHMASVLRELLNEYRKYNIKMIMSTQASDGLGKDVYDAIMEITSTVIAFAVGGTTYKHIKSLMLLDEVTMANMESFKFCMFTSQGMVGQKGAGKGVYETAPVQYSPEYDPETESGKANIASYIVRCVKAHGSPVAVDELMPPSAENLGRIEIPFTFREYAVMVWLFNNGGRHPTSTVYNTLAKTFRLEPAKGPDSILKQGIERLLRRPGKFYLSESQDPEDGRMIALTAGAADELFIGDIPSGQRGGGEWHVSVIGRIAKAYRSQYAYVVVDMGGGNIQKPDALVVPYFAITKIDPDSGDEYVFDIVWHYDRSMAFEVESDPIGNPDQVYENFVKNDRKRYEVNYVVKAEKQRGDVFEILKKKGIASDRFKVWLESELPEAKHYGIGLIEPVNEPQVAVIEKPVVTLPPPKTEISESEAESVAAIKEKAKPFIARLKRDGGDQEALNELLSQGYKVIEENEMFRIKRYVGSKCIDDKNFRVKKKRNEGQTNDEQ